MAEVNPEELSQEQLRELALQHTIEAAPEPEEKPRDEKGRFAKPEPEPEEAEDVVYERVIDLKDGSGAQVFRGSTLDELVDNLAKAQENATKKIREQAAELRAKQEAAAKVVEEDDTMTEEQKYILSQKILTDPMSVIDEYVDRKLTKRDREQENLRKAQEDRDRQEFEEAKSWADSNPEYVSTERNAKRLLKWLAMESLPTTKENLQKAFEDLNESGLLEVKPEEQEQQDVETEEEAKPERIVRRVESTVVKRKVVGGSPLSAKRSTQAPTRNTSEPTEEEIAKMTQEQLRELALRAVMGS